MSVTVLPLPQELHKNGQKCTKKMVMEIPKLWKTSLILPEVFNTKSHPQEFISTTCISHDLAHLEIALCQNFSNKAFILRYTVMEAQLLLNYGWNSSLLCWSVLCASCAGSAFRLLSDHPEQPYFSPNFLHVVLIRPICIIHWPQCGTVVGERPVMTVTEPPKESVVFSQRMHYKNWMLDWQYGLRLPQWATPGTAAMKIPRVP